MQNGFDSVFFNLEEISFFQLVSGLNSDIWSECVINVSHKTQAILDSIKQHFQLRLATCELALRLFVVILLAVSAWFPLLAVSSHLISIC